MSSYAEMRRDFSKAVRDFHGAVQPENSEVHSYVKGPPQEEFPVTVKAPIITDGTTVEGVQPLLDFVKSIETHSNTEVAEKEAERLEPWFSALSIYLTRALKNVDPRSEVDQERETLKNLITPGALKAEFNAMAEYTRVTLTSPVVIMSHSIHEGPAAHLFGPERAYDPTFKYDPPFSFGFLKFFEGGNEATARSSTTIPTFTLDAKLMEEIAPHQPEELYRRFQAVVTDMNHDMLHHLHSLVIGSSVAHKFDGQDRFNNPIGRWAGSLPASSIFSGLEELSQISHGKAFMAPGNEALVKEVGANLDRFFDELARISKALPREKAHEVVDYFGTVMAQTLSRTFPFNHPLMTQCLDRMEKADPLVESELVQKASEQYARIAGSSSDPVINDIVKGYRQLGLDILPDHDKAATFKGLKLLQLAKLEPDEMRSHVPAPVGEAEQQVRANSDRAFLDLVKTVATTTGYRPK